MIVAAVEERVGIQMATFAGLKDLLAIVAKLAAFVLGSVTDSDDTKKPPVN